MLRFIAACAAAPFVCFAAAGADAAVSQVTIDGTGTGTIGGSSFDHAAFTITAQYDTASRGTIAPGIFVAPNVQAAVTISGIGNATFTQVTRTFVNEGVAVAGFTRDTGFGDILNVDGPTFATWDLLGDVGPVFDAIPVGQSLGLSTTLGTLNFSDYSNATFTAVVPEPAATAGLALTALAATLGTRRRGNPRGASNLQ